MDPNGVLSTSRKWASQVWHKTGTQLWRIAALTKLCLAGRCPVLCTACPSCSVKLGGCCFRTALAVPGVRLKASSECVLFTCRNNSAESPSSSLHSSQEQPRRRPSLVLHSSLSRRNQNFQHFLLLVHSTKFSGCQEAVFRAE